MNQENETGGFDLPEEGLDHMAEDMGSFLGGSDEAAESNVGVAPSGATMNTDVVMNIPVEVQIVLGSAEMPVSEIMTLQKGSTVALDRRIGEPVDIIVNGRKIAHGEITVVDNDPSRFGIRLTEITGAKPSW